MESTSVQTMTDSFYPFSNSLLTITLLSELLTSINKVQRGKTEVSKAYMQMAVNIPNIRYIYVYMHEEATQQTKMRTTRPSLTLFSDPEAEGNIFLRKSLDFQRTAWRYIPEDRTLHNHRCEILGSFMSNVHTFCSLTFAIILCEICEHPTAKKIALETYEAVHVR
jgi:hypothetical protein